ncbi:MAG: hypothetical protein ACLQVN_17650 [Bryobacteraceae bacterium]
MTARAGLTRADVVFLGGLAAICGLAVAVGLAPLRVFEHDTFFALDGAYRVLRGQVPHRDFSSAWGPLTFLMDAAGLKLSGMRPAGLGYANAAWGAVVAIWAYGIARPRLSSGLACAAGIYTLLLTVAPFALGYSPLAFSHAMAYNRYGFALLGIMLMEASEPGGVPGAFSSGAAWALLAFLKISYAVMAVPVLLLGWAFREAPARRFWWLCGGAGVVTLLALGYLRFDLADMLRDLAAAASGRSRSWRPGEMLNPASVAEAIPLVLLAAVCGWKSRRAPGLRVAAIAAVTLAVSGVLLSTNHQAESLPLAGYAAMVLASGALARWAMPRKIGVLLLMGLSVVPLALENGAALAGAAMEESRLRGAAADRLACARGRAMDFEPVASSMTSETGGPAYVDALNDGLDLIRRRAEPGAGVVAMDMFNPFDYLLDRRPPRGGIVAAAYNYAFSDAIHPSAGRFFGDARYAMVRKYSTAVEDYEIEAYHVRGLERIYGRALRERFRMVEETAHWELWERR